MHKLETPDPTRNLNQDLVRAIGRIRLIAFDFDGVFTDNSVLVNEDGKESVRCFRSDGLGLRKLDAVNVEYFIISTETNSVVAQRAKKLAIPCFHGCGDKVSVLDKLISDRSIQHENAMFVGNDINDLPCLKSGVFPVGVKDSYPEVLKVIRLRTSRVGGYGAVREICDLVHVIKSK